MYRPDDFNNTRASVAIGQMAWSAGPDNTAIGSGAMAGYLTTNGRLDVGGTDYYYWVLNSVQEATAIGASANAQADFATALGANTVASAQGAVAIGAGSVADQADTVSFGNAALQRRLTNLSDGTADNDAATVGQMNAAVAGVSIDANAALAATRANTASIATNTAAIAGNTSAIAGNTNAISDLQSGAAGVSARIAYFDVNSAGAGASAGGVDALALGRGTSSAGENAVALGVLASSSQLNAIAIGQLANANGNAATVIGRRAQADGNSATAVGLEASASGTRSTAVGRGASASGIGSTAVGMAASAGHNRSTAVGANASTTASDQVMLGGQGSHVVIADMQASTEAQGGVVYNVTIDENGVLGRQATSTLTGSSLAYDQLRSQIDAIAAVTDVQFATLTSEVSALGSRVGVLEQGLSETNFRLEAYNDAAMGGIAAAMALGQGKIVPEAGISMTVAAATYGGQQGFGGSLTGRVADKVYVSAGVSGNTGDDRVGGTVSATIGF